MILLQEVVLRSAMIYRTSVRRNDAAIFTNARTKKYAPPSEAHIDISK